MQTTNRPPRVQYTATDWLTIAIAAICFGGFVAWALYIVAGQ